MAGQTENNVPQSLFILIHGLLGSHKHMHSVRDLILQNNKENSLVLIPCKNSFFKTFDGIEIVGDRVIKEIKIFLKTRSEKEIKSLRWINFVSYSMGGLISRYVIGEMALYLEKRYPMMKFNTFMTFASPHLGVNFFKDGKFPYNVLTTLGSNILGRSGKQIFVKDKDGPDSEKLLVKISKGKYLAALKQFKFRIAIANGHNDRTVAFYSSFITDLGYGCNLEALEEDKILSNWLKFPQGVVLDVTKKMDTSERVGKDSSLSFFTKLKLCKASKYTGKLLLIALFVVFIFPIILFINTIGTIYSYINVWIHNNQATIRSRFLFFNKDWLSKKLDIDLDEDLDDDEMEHLIKKISRDGNYDPIVSEEVQDLFVADWELKKGTYHESIKNLTEDKKDALYFRYFIKKYMSNNIHDKFNNSEGRLPFDESRKEIYENLNNLKWIRVPYKLTGANTHRAIIARTGLESASLINRKALEFNISLLMQVCKYSKEDNEIECL
ncbi:hypothetical protein QEN19_002245 [Hanseniaspora menglaensis]